MARLWHASPDKARADERQQPALKGAEAALRESFNDRLAMVFKVVANGQPVIDLKQFCTVLDVFRAPLSLEAKKQVRSAPK